jgi:hypothetical protein
MQQLWILLQSKLVTVDEQFRIELV